MSDTVYFARNSPRRWAEVFSEPSRIIAMRHVENGGTIHIDDEVLGLTVARLKAGLRLVFPTEELPDDEVLEVRLCLLEVWLIRERAIDNFKAANETGRFLTTELERMVGESFPTDDFSDSMEALG